MLHTIRGRFSSPSSCITKLRTVISEEGAMCVSVLLELFELGRLIPVVSTKCYHANL